MLDVALVYVAAINLIAAALAALTVHKVFSADAPPWTERTTLLGAVALPALALIVADPAGALYTALATLTAALALRQALPRLTVAGALQMAAMPLALLIGLCWTYLLLSEHGAPDWLLTFTMLGGIVAMPMGALTFAGNLARQAVLTHAHWRRPRLPLEPAVRRGAPRVSVHLPCYSEPPEIVKAVLDRLAAQHYPDFEVLVCDNNTPDESVWRPIEQHCRALNRRCGEERFRFFHVAPLAGAKAGALNYLLDRMDPAASLVAVIDADYLARPDFLSRLTGYFDDPRIGYVQTPHDYHAYEDSAYLRACYWEYMPSNKVEMPGINEYGAAFTIGTMCVIRRDALERAGRWAEWCLTEDSEVSVRLRALGLSGIYVQETFGRGLIPETFDDYKKQRFRWTAGPVQQLRRYWREYLPEYLGGSPVIDGWSKLLEVQRAIAPLTKLAAVVTGLVTALAGTFLIGGGAMLPLELPDAAWLALTLGAVTTGIRTWHRLSLSGCRSLGDMAMGELARLSLGYVQMVAGVAGLSQRPLAWRRTPKFEAQRSGVRALLSTLPEIALAGLFLMLSLLMMGLNDSLGGDFVVLAVIAGIASSAQFLAAPVMAVLSEAHLAAKTAAPIAERDVLQPA